MSQTILRMIDEGLHLVCRDCEWIFCLGEYSEFYNLCLVGFGSPIFQDYAKRFGTNFKF